MNIKQFVFNPFGVNCYVLSNSAGDAILIDPSVSNEHEQEALSGYIADAGLSIRRVLNTHLHLDHVLGNAFVERKFGVKAEAHEEDNFLLDLQEEQSQMFGLPVEEIAPPLGGFLAEGDTVEIPGIKLHVIHVAGHSPGGIAFFCEDDSTPILFPGDILFAGSMGRADLFGGDEDALVSGIKNKLLTLPGETHVLPGHGPSTTIEDERRSFPA
ncbi:MBL fold metallo-hydrolase [Fibrobacter sp.]|uniref:MBL fold metallo-hydrolase n=1 Tax=Fibrobacter sp. TaxID=35828 RepID=UPI00388E5CC0